MSDPLTAQGGLPWEIDPALTLGMSVFETIGLSPQGELLELEPHLARLERSALWLGAPLSRGSLFSRLKSACAESRDLHRGPSALRYTLSVSGQDHISVRTYDERYVGGEVTVAPLLSPPSPYAPRVVKHSSRLEWRAAARRFGVAEVLLCDERGEVLEADQSSVFALQGGRLLYPPYQDGRRLESVGLRRVLRCAQALGVPCLERPIFLTDQVERLCLSSSLKGLALARPSHQGDQRLNLGSPGLLTSVAGEGDPKSEALWVALRAQVRAEMGLP